jgi:hypothetical protein
MELGAVFPRLRCVVDDRRHVGTDGAIHQFAPSDGQWQQLKLGGAAAG